VASCFRLYGEKECVCYVPMHWLLYNPCAWKFVEVSEQVTSHKP
jgi:hypothetical protein